MALKFVVVLACVALVAQARVTRDAPTTPLEDLQKHATEFAKTFQEQLSDAVSSQGSKDVQKALKDGTASIAEQLKSLGATLTAALTDASGKTKEALEASRANIERTAAELRQAHPELEQQAAELQQKLKQAVTNAVQETQKLAKQVQEHAEQANKEVAPKIKAAYDDLVKQAQEVQKKVQEAANKQ